MANTIEDIDYNCDLAQTFGIYKNENERKMLDYVSSVNIACGFHAGEALSIRNALLDCKERNIAIGAHIGFPDMKGFGNRNMDLTIEETEAIVIYQIGAIKQFAKSYGLEIEHVRLHGAMYERATRDYNFALAVVNAIKKVDTWLRYISAAGETADRLEAEANIIIGKEIMLNKIYLEDGTIDKGAKDIENADFAMTRLTNLLKSSEIRTKDGKLFSVKCDTIHFSTNAANTIEIAKRANEIKIPKSINYGKAVASGWV